MESKFGKMDICLLWFFLFYLSIGCILDYQKAHPQGNLFGIPCFYRHTPFAREHRFLGWKGGIALSSDMGTALSANCLGDSCVCHRDGIIFGRVGSVSVNYEYPSLSNSDNIVFYENGDTINAENEKGIHKQ